MNGKQLRAIRTKLGWTQAEMAKELRSKPNTVARWERDERGITEPMAKLIETVYASEKKKGN
jgi:transcriptional regulator with XRE-family HTH domain